MKSRQLNIQPRQQTTAPGMQPAARRRGLSSTETKRLFVDVPVEDAPTRPQHFHQASIAMRVKRGLDVSISLSLLIVFALPMLLIAVLVKLTSRGPVFYRQQRVGLGGRRFEICKFRTMRVDAEAETGPVWAVQNDPRQTALGGVLRRMSLDELLQLINVLRGDMSLVGPRPERPIFVRQFSETLPSYPLRHQVPPGITGWAQVNGWRGNTSLEKRLQYDLDYALNWTLGFDLYIMMLTPLEVLGVRNVG